ncbi:MAG: DUF4390 domain-containing protein [Gemmatimonadaceae bacterium]|nr:DUF4390 domain-containing protein [Gemmatimonadaceae bacterium]
MRRRALLLTLALALATPAVAAQPRPELEVILPAAAALGEEGPMVRVRNALAERYVTDLLRNGFPARLNFRAELWTTGGFFNARQRSVEWDVLVRYDALRREYEVVRVVRDSAVARTRFAQFADVVAEIERPVRAPILPLPDHKSQYYNVTLTLEMLSVSDLDEVERWLRGELKPAVRGQRNPGTAVGRGMRTLLARMLGGEMRRLEARSKTFRP